MGAPARIAIVTGASGGIGQVVASRLAADGFGVVLHYAGNPAKGEAAAAELKATGAQAIAVRADVSQPSEVERLFKGTLETWGKIDVVVHCAGIMTLKPIIEGDVDHFDKVIAVNLRGTFLVLSQAAQHLTQGGRIIAFSSSQVIKCSPTYGAYIASKAGVEGLVGVLANELRGRSITVNAVAPGPVATELFLSGKSQARIDELSKLAPLERLGQPQDIARVVSFLRVPTAAGSTRRFCK